MWQEANQETIAQEPWQARQRIDMTCSMCTELVKIPLFDWIYANWHKPEQMKASLQGTGLEQCWSSSSAMPKHCRHLHRFQYRWYNSHILWANCLWFAEQNPSTWPGSAKAGRTTSVMWPWTLRRSLQQLCWNENCIMFQSPLIHNLSISLNSLFLSVQPGSSHWECNSNLV